MSGFDEIDAIRDLLGQVEAVESELMPNERALYKELREKYTNNDGTVGFADKRCLEVILRNVLIRKQ